MASAVEPMRETDALEPVLIVRVSGRGLGKRAELDESAVARDNGAAPTTFFHNCGTARTEHSRR